MTIRLPISRLITVLLTISSVAGMSAQAACDLAVTNAWIREAPPTVTAMAGYAVLANTGNRPLTLSALQSPVFASVQMHETLTENGISKMRALPQVSLAPGAKVEFTPGGKHFMLMQPKNALRAGDVVVITITDGNGCDTRVQFKVMRNAASEMDHSKMDHSKMDHSKMDNSSMDHAGHDHSDH